jgi:hypothetical protein
MIGEVAYNSHTGRFTYREALFDNGKPDMESVADCSRAVPTAPPPVAKTPVPVPVPAPVPAPSAPAANNNTVQQNGPIVTPAPNNNITITIVPGSGAEQYKMKPPEKAEGS